MRPIKTVHLTVVFVFIVLLFAADYGFAFPTSWWVNGNGYTGYLNYRINPSNNKIKGKLLNTPVEGYLVGRHIILHRYPQGKRQIWEGWIMDRRLGANIPSYKRDYFIAGTISVDGNTVYPWFGIEKGKTGGIPGINNQPTTVAECRHYAEIAVKQNDINMQRHCGYRGPLWSSNYNTHYNWCMKVSLSETQQRYRQRHTMLLNCKPKPKPIPAADISGTWRWFDGETVWIYRNGTARSSYGNRGVWKARWNGSRYIYTISWNNGRYIDTLSLKGDVLDGHNQGGTHVWGKRIKNIVTIKNPKVGGVALDWCREWAQHCGKPAADAWCRKHGYKRAANYVVQKNAPPTRIISSGRICNANYCGRITEIECIK